jgi:hypothetical protein
MVNSVVEAHRRRLSAGFRSGLNHIGQHDNPSPRQRQQGSSGPSGSDGGFEQFGVAMSLGMVAAVWAARAAGLGAGAQRLIEDSLDGAGAAAAFSTAAQTPVDLPCRARQIIRCGGYRGADIVVAEDVTGTNNHGVKASPVMVTLGATDIECTAAMQKEKPPFQPIPNWKMPRLIAVATTIAGLRGPETAPTGSPCDEAPQS